MIMIGNTSEEELMKLIKRGSGSLVTYFGYVRAESHGKSVKYMICRENEESKRRMDEIEREIRDRYPVKDVLLFHSTGKLKVGELLAAVIISSIHRKEGFEACKYGIDKIKENEVVKREEIFN